MRSWILAASLFAAAGAGGPAAQAADLDEGPPPQRYGSVYDDPRYADMYRRPERPPAYALPPPPPYAAPFPRERLYRDDDPPPYARPDRYAYEERPGHAVPCLPREVVRDRLTRHGWHDFHDGALKGNVAVVRARRPSGRLFELTIERCSGEIVTAYPLESRVYGPYAYGPRPWWQRSY